jgi:hypothetical protein
VWHIEARDVHTRVDHLYQSVDVIARGTDRAYYLGHSHDNTPDLLKLYYLISL